MTTIALPGAGTQLDALIDEKVFGYEWFDVGPDDIAPKGCTHRLARPAGDGYYGHIRAERHADGRVVVLGGRDYSTDIAAAWWVVEKMCDRFHAVIKSPFEAGDNYFAGFTALGTSGWNGRPDFSAHATTPELAICWASIPAAEALAATQLGVHSGARRTTGVPETERPATASGTRDGAAEQQGANS